VLPYITLLLACQLAGEVTARLIGLSVPGPVIGMVILFALLLLRGGIPKGLEEVTRGLLGNLSLLFVPAGVGVSVHLSLLASEWLPISAAVVVSTLLTVAVTGLVMSLSTRGSKR